MLQKANVAYNVKSTRSWNRKRNRGSGIGLSWNPKRNRGTGIGLSWNRKRNRGSGIRLSWNPKRNRESEVELSWNPKWNPESGSQLTLGIGVPFLTWFRNRVSNPGPVLRNFAVHTCVRNNDYQVFFC